MCSNLIQYTFGVKEGESMTDEQSMIAQKTLIEPPYPEYNKQLNDKLFPSDPKYALFSFVKTPEIDYIGELMAEKVKLQSALPNFNFERFDKILTVMKKEKTVFGVAKIRGAFKTEKAARERACKLIKESDSLHSIMTCKIGVPFPLVTKGYAKEVESINLKETLESVLSKSEADRRKALRDEMKEVEDRAAALKLEEEFTDIDRYITERVKSACLQENIIDNLKKLMTCFENIKRLENPLIKEEYLTRYNEARKDVGLTDSFYVKYMSVSTISGLNACSECFRILNYSVDS
ncbi:core protein 25 [Lymphocystis disease virus 4]|uniref:Core protein 25 n=1 Tax=Lymphocystis disease virus 4 TaxID=2704413 RepID=A0A6B9XIB9_9VIRU|nr:core protein 25 [Lymphocystis disease virus 4]QHR78490.1 core protein 25 [Lymphocystis disease virus 4]